MTPSYNYIDSPDYINNLTFDHVETYSFQRGPAYEENKKLLKAEYERLKVRKDRGKSMTAEQEERFAVLHDLFEYTQLLINSKGQFHPSSQKINTFSHDHPIAGRIKQILQTPVTEQMHYRDAFVFYNNQHQIVSTLNVCLSCMYMETTPFNHINGDITTYDQLKKLFLETGHNVEDPEYSWVAEMERLKQKKGKR